MTKKKIQPELLAPASDVNAALAAFSAGADAVYAGLSKFNARERGDNFNVETFKQLIQYGKQLDKRVYLTLNTLVKEAELREIAELLDSLYDCRPDAVIIQDLGVLRMIKQYFPGYVTHASTQMGIHNSAGLRLAENLGIKRVILERQVTLEELRQITQKSPVEVEVFVHGALCCSLSGQCLLSSWGGGWSGNRGKCKQSCRRRYHTRDGNGFFLSTRDLCLLDQIPVLREMNIASFKIEGRLRKADYVETVVSAYRMVMDATKNELPATIKKARGILTHSYGRKWSTGFLDHSKLDSLIDHESMGASGMVCGKVTSPTNNGFHARLSRPLHLGDRIRVQPATGDVGPSITITKLSIKGRDVKKAGSNETCFVHCDKEIPIGGWVFKIGHSFKERSLPPVDSNNLRHSLDFHVVIDMDKIYIETLDGSRRLWETGINAQEAEKCPMEAKNVVKEFQKANSKHFQASTVTATINAPLFLPSQELRALRKTFWEQIDETQTPDSITYDGMMRFYDDYQKAKGEDCESGAQVTVMLAPKDKPPKFKHSIIAKPIFDICPKTTEATLPFFCPEKDLETLRNAISRTYQAGIRRFRATSLYAIELLKDFSDIVLSTSFPLPVCNSLASSELKDLNVDKVQAWIELEKGSLEAFIAKSAIPVEIYAEGNLPLLTTRARLPVSRVISDARGNKFFVQEDRVHKLSYVYADKPFKLPVADSLSTFVDLTAMPKKARETSSFNYTFDWV